MADKACSLDSCGKVGKLVCTGGCKNTQYCSKGCQRSHWKKHMVTCPAAQTHKCYVIHAPPDGVIGIVSKHIEPFNLWFIGNEWNEKQELKHRLGWTQPQEAGKFYDHAGSDLWYYWVYGDAKAEALGKPLNVLSKRLCYEDVHGDLIVLRSGPTNFPFPKLFSKASLIKTVQFYETEDRKHVFASREKSRCGEKCCLDLSGIPGTNL